MAGEDGGFDLGAAHGSISIDVSSIASSIQQATRTFDAGISGMGASLESVGRSITTVAGNLSAVFSPLALGIAIATNAALDFNESITNTGAVLGLTVPQIEALGDELQDIGRNATAGPQAISAAYYDVAGGIADASLHIATLNAAVHTAQAGNASLTGTTKALIATLNSYKFSADRASFASDVLTRTVGMGVGTMDELASSIPSVTGLAHSLGIEFDDLGGMMAYLSTQGNTFSESSVQITSMMTAMLNPNQQMIQGLRELGYETGQSAIEALGLAGAYDALADTSVANQLGMAKLTGNVNALRGATALAGDDVDSFMSKFRTGLEGATAAAEAIQLSSPQARIDLFNASLQNLAITIGETLIPKIAEIADSIKPIVDGIAAWVDANPDLSGAVFGFIGVLGIGLPILATAGFLISNIGTAFLALSGPVAAAVGLVSLPVLLIGGAIAGAALLIVNNLDKIRDGLADLATAIITGDWTAIGENVRSGIQGAIDGIQNFDVESVKKSISGALATIIIDPRNDQWARDFASGLYGLLNNPANVGGLSLEGFRASIQSSMAAILIDPRNSDSVLGLARAIYDRVNGLEVSSETFGAFASLMQAAISNAFTNIFGGDASIITQDMIERGVGGGGMFSGIVTGVSDQLSAAFSQLQLDVTALKDAIQSQIEGAVSQVFFDVTTLKSNIETQINSAFAQIQLAATNLRDRVRSQIEDTVLQVYLNTTAFKSGIETQISTAINGIVLPDITPLTNSVKSEIEGALATVNAIDFSPINAVITNELNSAVANLQGVSIDLSGINAWATENINTIINAVAAVAVAVIGGPIGLTIGAAKLIASAIDSDFLGISTLLDTSGIRASVTTAIETLKTQIGDIIASVFGGGGSGGSIITQDMIERGVGGGVNVESNPIADMLTKMINGLKAGIELFGPELRESLQQIGDGIGGFISNLSGADTSGIDNIIAAIMGIWGAVAGLASTILITGIDIVSDIFENVLPRIGTALGGIITIFSGFGEGDPSIVMKGVGDAIKGLVGSVGGVAVGIADPLIELIEKITGIQLPDVGETFRIWGDTLKSAWLVVQIFWDNLKRDIEAGFLDIKIRILGGIQDLIDGIAPTMEFLGLAVPTVAIDLSGAQMRQEDLAVGDEVARIINEQLATTGAIDLTVPFTFEGSFSSWNTTLGAAIESAAADGALPVTATAALDSIGLSIVDGVVTGIDTAAPQVTASTTALAELAASGFVTALGISSPSTRFAGYGSSIVQGLALGMVVSLPLLLIPTALIIGNLTGIHTEAMKIPISFGLAFAQAAVALNVAKNPIVSALNQIAETLARVGDQAARAAAGIASVVNANIPTAPAGMIPSFARGINNVPQDTIALLHRGERVLTAQENAEGGGGGVTVNGGMHFTIQANPNAGPLADQARDFAEMFMEEIRSR